MMSGCFSEKLGFVRLYPIYLEIFRYNSWSGMHFSLHFNTYNLPLPDLFILPNAVAVCPWVQFTLRLIHLQLPGWQSLTS